MDWPELEIRWLRDELLLLERNPEAHHRLALLMEERQADCQTEAQCLLAAGLASPVRPAARRQTAELVWGRLKDKASEPHTRQVCQLLANLEEDPWAIIYLKKLFRILAAQQGRKGLNKSSYVAEELIYEQAGGS